MQTTRYATHIHPTQASGDTRVLTIRLRVQFTTTTPGASIHLADLLLQAGTIATGWIPHVTEMPWIAGITARG